MMQYARPPIFVASDKCRTLQFQIIINMNNKKYNTQIGFWFENYKLHENQPHAFDLSLATFWGGLGDVEVVEGKHIWKRNAEKEQKNCGKQKAKK